MWLEACGRCLDGFLSSVRIPWRMLSRSRFLSPRAPVWCGRWAPVCCGWALPGWRGSAGTSLVFPEWPGAPGRALALTSPTLPALPRPGRSVSSPPPLPHVWGPRSRPCASSVVPVCAASGPTGAFFFSLWADFLLFCEFYVVGFTRCSSGFQLSVWHVRSALRRCCLWPRQFCSPTGNIRSQSGAGLGLGTRPSGPVGAPPATGRPRTRPCGAPASLRGALPLQPLLWPGPAPAPRGPLGCRPRLGGDLGAVPPSSRAL